ncbi:monovalent cation/H+ antiporter complex subunit F [Algiphilus sp.]|uniref:monovalent cation/H+ antiporter complex subunit F n=2 Tax=Algiphilus sp. TaxID=1872431 RepID=UPI0025BB6B22|nr:monovalent cation/H+ antiporter complex subunit F [Algiphilus sp.]MCK5770751.1 pH regulation protein F [Algiphilus sp.]
MSWMGEAVYIVLALALVLALLRLLAGPSLADRVVALELIASLTVGLIAANAVFADMPAALDVALVLALTGFLAAIAFSRYLERRGED